MQKLANEPCPLCNGKAEPWRHRRGFDVFHCQQCDNAFVPNHLVPDNVDAIYSTDYFSGDAETGYPGYLADQKLIEKNFADRIQWVGAIAPTGRLLEIGSAYGFFLKVAREFGWDAEGVELIEACAREAARLSGATVHAGDFLDMRIAGSFDVVAMFDVIEHMRDPIACIERAYTLLKPGGIFVIETGDRAWPWARFLGNYWYFLDPPQHRYYFSAKGIQFLLRRAGFEREIRIRRIGRRVSFSNIAFKLSAAIPEGRLRTAIADRSKEQLPGSLYLNFGDGMLLAARKPVGEKSALGRSNTRFPSREKSGGDRHSFLDFEIEKLDLATRKTILTIDVEEWYHANFRSMGDQRDKRLPSRVEQGVDAILNILANKGGHATFFILGCVAERNPKIVERIARAGHEVACHGWSHALIYRQTREQFETDIQRAQTLLRQLSGQQVVGFRAPSWSITDKSLWALESLVANGFKYDSSVFPAATYLYGIDRAPTVPYRIGLSSGKQLIEVPPSVLDLGGYRLGAGGGFYLRVLPLSLQRLAMLSYAKRGAPFVFYAHPREFDPGAWNLRLSLSFTEQFIHRFGISNAEKKLEKLLVGEPCSIASVLASHLEEA
jgi:polysaccharide deacetylase family protein (PEP-CTERM system associated)